MSVVESDFYTISACELRGVQLPGHRLVRDGEPLADGQAPTSRGAHEVAQATIPHGHLVTAVPFGEWWILVDTGGIWIVYGLYVDWILVEKCW